MKQRNETIVLVVLVVIAGLVWYFERSNPAMAPGTALFTQNYKPLNVENPQLRIDEIERARKTEYRSNGRNPFSMVAPPAPNQVKPKSTPVGPIALIDPPKPTVAVPPANLKFFGYGTVPDGSGRRAFFTNGEDVYIALEGETLLGRYRILHINNTNLEFEELSSGLHGVLNLEEQAPGSSP